MRINELISEEQLDELSFGKKLAARAARFAQGAGDVIGGTLGGIQGAWNRGARAYQRGKQVVDPEGSGVAPRAVNAPAPAPTTPNPAPAPTTPNPAPTPAPAPAAPTPPVRKAGDVIKANQVVGSYTGKPGQEWEIVGGPVWNNTKDDPSKDRYNGITRDQSGQRMYISAADAKKNYDLAEQRRRLLRQQMLTLEFHSKFLGRKI